MKSFKSLVLAIIFALHKPYGYVSIATYIPRRYGQHVLQAFRRTEHFIRKIEITKAHIQFLSTCQHHGLTPKFLHFKLYNQRHIGQNHTRKFQDKLLINEIKQHNKRLQELQDQHDQATQHLATLITTSDYNFLFDVTMSTANRVKHDCELRHDRKLKNLGFEPDIASSLKPDDVIFNQSDITLSEVEKRALARGLNFSVSPSKQKLPQHLLPFEQLIDDLEHRPINQVEQGWDQCITSIKNIALNSYYVKDNCKPNLPKDEYKALLNLSKNKSIIITRPDKGNGIVIMNKHDYLSKMNDILKDKTKFKVVSGNIYKNTMKLENRVWTFLRKLKSNMAINSKQYDRLKPTGSTPGRLYGLPKVHKIGTPCRPVLSAINTATYALAKLLVPIINPLCINKYTAKDSFSVAKLLNKTVMPNNITMCSFDIVSLYTNIPLEEAINTVANALFPPSTDKGYRVSGFTKDLFVKALQLCTQDAVFIFNNCLYMQIDGIAMGNPISASLCNAFLAIKEQEWLKSCHQVYKPLFYLRYVDDTLLFFASKEYIDPFLAFLNSQPTSISFTKEEEKQGHIAFLDLNIYRHESPLTIFSTSIFRKKTFTGLLTKYDSCIPHIFKLNLISSLIYRAWHLSSSYLNLHIELTNIQHLLLKNSFPLSLIYENIHKLVTKHYTADNTQSFDEDILVDIRRLFLSASSSQGTTDDHSILPPQSYVFFHFPFIPHISPLIKQQLTTQVRKFFPHVQFRVIFKPSYTIRHMFPYKDSFPFLMKPNVVYKYVCGKCELSYIGSTSRCLFTRSLRHAGLSSATLGSIASVEHSNIRKHTDSCIGLNTIPAQPDFDIVAPTSVDISKFSILSQHNDENLLRISEALHIHFEQPHLTIKTSKALHTVDNSKYVQATRQPS